MARAHGADQQKRVAKPKPAPTTKRASQHKPRLKSPPVRFRNASAWPVTCAIAGEELWTQGSGACILGRKGVRDEVAWSVFFVDAHCLGVFKAEWGLRVQEDFDDLVAQLGAAQSHRFVKPEFLVKLVQGAVAYALAIGLPPHREYRHASLLLDGIDPATSAEDFAFGYQGKPLYVRGPSAKDSRANAIEARVRAAGGACIRLTAGFDPLEMADLRDMPPGFDTFPDSVMPGPEEWL